VLASGQVNFVDFYRETSSSSIHLALLVPVISEQDTFHPLGTLILRIDPNVYLLGLTQAD
jgi:hypothetical protein